MDYESIHGRGTSNFSPSPHRMPTVSAAHALRHLKDSPSRCISTSLPHLDQAVQNKPPLNPGPGSEPVVGGISRGKLTEIFGPPAVGKTAICTQLAVNTLNAGESVIWVDAAHPVSPVRFHQVLDASQKSRPGLKTATSPAPPPLPDLLDRLVHFSTPTLAHLLALFARASIDHPRPNTSLIIIDSFSTLISDAFPRQINAGSRNPRAPNPSARKFPILQHLLSTLQKLAATRNIAIVICSRCVTRMRPGIGAALVPAITATTWDQGFACRIGLFRDWGWIDDEGKTVTDVRLIEVIKAEGVILHTGKAWLVGFSIDEAGLVPLPFPTRSIRKPNHRSLAAAVNKPIAAKVPQKRKFSAADREVPDSEDDDDEAYGWAKEDEQNLPPMPPQWQGSEDILIPPQEELDEEEEEGLNSGEEGEEGEEVHGPVASLTEIEDSEDELAL